jgi:hypothetical protein
MSTQILLVYLHIFFIIPAAVSEKLLLYKEKILT